jgi:hypothetical protein
VPALEVMMLAGNPFLPLADFLAPGALQGYAVLMVIAVAAGTVFDLLHKRSAEYFTQRQARVRAAATRRLGGAEAVVLAARMLASEVAASGEFCHRGRRASHLLMSYGFVLYVVTTAVLIFGYPGAARVPAALPLLWNLGVLMVIAGGYWFFLFLRVDVAHDGRPPWRLVRADLFIASLLASVTFALLFELVALAGNAAATRVVAGLYLVSTTLLFVSVPWSKFAHMFYKPVVAFEKRVEEADGSSDLPPATGGKRCPPSHT